MPATNTQATPMVLVVEDDPLIADIISQLLEEVECRSHHASTAAAALAALGQQAFDLVILDWMLPDGQGDMLCHIIKDRAEGIFLPVLMLTARSTIADRVAGLQAGADDYLTKPFHADELQARVRALLRIRNAEIGRARALEVLVQQHAQLKHAYNQLRITQMQLVHAAKLASLGELVAGVAHELNNPLAIILGNAELLPPMQAEEDQHSVAQIIESVLRARQVVQSLTTFARQGPKEQSWYQPEELIKRVIDIRSASLQRAGITLDVAYAPDLPVIYVDRSQIQQVILALLLNAERVLAKQPAPLISVRAFLSSAPVGPPIVAPQTLPLPSETSDTQMLVIDIADNGPGLDESIHNRIFEPFATSDRFGSGPGLGLATAYGIIERHNGSLQMASETGRGATFRIALPITHASTELVALGDFSTYDRQ